MTVRISACDRARVRLTPRGHQVLNGHLLGQRAKSAGQLKGDELVVSVKDLMSIFGRHYESKPTGAEVPFVDNEIEFETENLPTPDAEASSTANAT